MNRGERRHRANKKAKKRFLDLFPGNNQRLANAPDTLAWMEDPKNFGAMRDHAPDNPLLRASHKRYVRHPKRVPGNAETETGISLRSRVVHGLGDFPGYPYYLNVPDRDAIVASIGKETKRRRREHAIANPLPDEVFEYNLFNNTDEDYP